MKTYKFQPLSCGLLPVAIVLAAICSSATLEAPLLQETAKPDSNADGAPSNLKIKIGNLVPTPSTASLKNDVWIAVRTERKSGDGSEINPFDGSSQAKFDRLLASFGQNTVIHLGPGTFETDMVTRRWRPLNGWQIKGAGVDVTIIRAVGNLSRGGNWVAVGLDCGTSPTAESNDVTVSDLTVDCNWTTMASSAPVVNGQPNCKVGIITLMGSNNVVERVHGRNQYGSARNGKECFGIRLAAPADAGASSNIIRDCVNDSPQGTYGSPYSIAGGGTAIRNSGVYNCQAYGVNNGQDTGFTSGGVNLAFVQDATVENCFFVDCVSGIAYADTGTITGLYVRGNTCLRASRGVEVVLSDARPSNIQVSENYVNLQNRLSKGRAYGIAVVADKARGSNVVVQNNRLTYEATGSGYNDAAEIWMVNIDGLRLEGNTSDAMPSGGYIDRSSTGLRVLGNRTWAGIGLRGLADRK